MFKSIFIFCIVFSSCSLIKKVSIDTQYRQDIDSTTYIDKKYVKTEHMETSIDVKETLAIDSDVNTSIFINEINTPVVLNFNNKDTVVFVKEKQVIKNILLHKNLNKTQQTNKQIKDSNTNIIENKSQTKLTSAIKQSASIKQTIKRNMLPFWVFVILFFIAVKFVFKINMFSIIKRILK